MPHVNDQEKADEASAKHDVRLTSDLSHDLAARCLSIDLEVNPRTARILTFAAVRSGDQEPLVFRQGRLTDALAALERFAQTADYLLGHNIIHFDRVHLEAAGARPSILEKPTIDTLWLNPLAFPRNPYHHLVKHYQDGRLQGGHVNDPELDARLVFEVLANQIDALSSLNQSSPDSLQAFHWLTTTSASDPGFDAVFLTVRGCRRPKTAEAKAAMLRLLQGQACEVQIRNVLVDADQSGWSLAYALAWISVAGGDSVMSPWVKHQFPEAGCLVRQLREAPCSEPSCRWCHVQNDPRGLLKRWFGFDGFRREPADKGGRPLQEAIVAAAMAGKSLLGILPTGTGKSVCYQLPALSRFHKAGDLTVVISPLVALMADQVAGLQRQGISACITINGLLSLPERHHALDQVRLGDAAILLISPEQLRSPSVRSVLKQREIGYWVLDEAHCVSKWGHDFRPDYRYVARFIRESSGDGPPPPILCLTATAKPGVIRDIRDHFSEKLDVELELIDGGAVRHNLTFEVIPTSEHRKLSDIVAMLGDALPQEGCTGAIIYCATRKSAERVAGFLSGNGFAAAYFHAGLKPEAKREVQDQFLRGELRVIAATNAFGMGIDKPDIRLVVHGDIPGSLENYVQEAGRAGRDRDAARCVLLFSGDDIERQFSLSARSRLAQPEISAILKSLRRLERRSKRKGEVIATPGEIVKEELDQAFVRDSATDDTRVKTAVAWLEEAALLERNENRVRIYPSSLKIRTLVEARQILEKADLEPAYKRNLLDLIQRLMLADKDQGISTDDLSGAANLPAWKLRKALNDLESLGIAANDTAITVFLRLATDNASKKRFAAIAALEIELINQLRELAPDLETGATSELNLRLASQELRDAGHGAVRPDIVERLLRSLSRDGRDDDQGKGSLTVRKRDRGHLAISLLRDWDVLAQTAALRRNGAQILLRFLESCAPAGARGNDVQVETTLGALMGALAGDLEIRKRVSHPSKLLDRSLLWLHEQGVITLGRGLTIFRPAILVHLNPDNRRFTKADFEPLLIHYGEQTLQIHIMEAYAKHGLSSMGDAHRLVDDYFTLERDAFVDRWLSGRAATELQRQTTPESWRAIVEALGNRDQTRIVADDREQTNVLVLAGPGSGKTRVLVHRIAYLIRVRRENPRGILALAYNRHAAAEIRRRLHDLIGDDARGVTVSTCHGLAMRLIGASFAKRSDRLEPDAFDKVMQEAAALLRGDGLSPDEADAQRETLIEGYRWILVDEYQDIGPDEYELIAAVAGRSLEDEDSRLSLFAVGDDDQNIYAFSGASVAFIRRFEEDYAAKPAHLIENYRSTAHIIRAANHIIRSAAERMKADHDITVNRARERDPDGGKLESLDPVGQGRAQVLSCGTDNAVQAVTAVRELERLSRLVPDWTWSKAAVIARQWHLLQPVRSYCEAHGIPVQLASENPPHVWRLREMQALLGWLKARPGPMVSHAAIAAWLNEQATGPWWSLLRQGVEELGSDFGDQDIAIQDVIEWLAEWCRGMRKLQSGLLLLTAHGAKGLEFDDVVVLDGGWERMSSNEDRDASRRLFYVAMTRARRSLALMRMNNLHPFLDSISDRSFLMRRKIISASPALSACRHVYQRLALSDVDLSFAGRLIDSHPSLNAIAALAVGDPVVLKRTGDRWLIVDRNDNVVGRLSKTYRPPPDKPFVQGTVFAVTMRVADDSSGVYQQRLKRSRWDVVVPEFVFETSR